MNARRLVALLTCLLAVLGAAGTANAKLILPAYPICEHPYPCGDEWPKGLKGPFEADAPQRVTMRSHDGTPLGGYLFLPQLPKGVGAPTVLISSPYDFAPGAGGTSDATTGPIDALVADGYAVAQFSV